MIYCIAMGTADAALLRRLAGRHLGRYRGIGFGDGTKGKKK
jgi:hypothetical protein